MTLIIFASLLLIAPLSIYFIYLMHTSGSELTFVIYGSEYCDECIKLKEFLHEEAGGARVIFLDLTDENNSARFMEIMGLLYGLAAPLATQCPSCEPPTSQFEALIPLTGIFKEGELKAIVIGFYNEEFWKEALSLSLKSNATYFIAPGMKVQIHDKQLKERIEDIIIPH